MAAGLPDGRTGDVEVREAYAILEQDPKAQLVDVRTKAEWSFVGLPDLTALGKDVVLAEWQRYPVMDVAPDFVDGLGRELTKRGVARDAPLLFLCRSGARSASAAEAMRAAGWRGARNVAGGFEGPLDPRRRRGAAGGWKAADLPWVQS